MMRAPSVHPPCTPRAPTNFRALHGYTLIPRNRLGICEKRSVHLACTSRVPTPHTPLRVSPLSGAWEPPSGLTLLALFTFKK
jgi:hypothetical protein